MLIDPRLTVHVYHKGRLACIKEKTESIREGQRRFTVQAPVVQKVDSFFTG